MLKRLAAVMAVVTGLGVNAAPALAEPIAFGCSLDAFSVPAVTGFDQFTGVAVGYVVGAAEAVSIRCVVRIDGAPADATGTAAGTSSATTFGDVRFDATDTQNVEICAVWSAGSTVGDRCFDTTTTSHPTQDVIDALVRLVSPVNPIWCNFVPCPQVVHAGMVTYIQGKPTS